MTDEQKRTVRIVAFRSEHTIVTVRAKAARYKIFRVFFGRDRSLFVTFPYFKHSTGILAAATIPGNGQNTSQVDLKIGGKIASHLVKYSHHPDGRAHFSQTGKVRTEILRQSIKLDTQRGHIFSVIIRGLSGFDQADQVSDVAATPKRTELTFDLGELPGSAIKFVARWYDISNLPLPLTEEKEPNVGPALVLQDADGKQQNGVLVASPYEDARHVLVIACELMPWQDQESEMMLFYGGFDAHEVMFDTALNAGFLTFLYPASEAEELKKILGSIDK
jgi:hypothetical protein